MVPEEDMQSLKDVFDLFISFIRVVLRLGMLRIQLWFVVRSRRKGHPCS